MVQWWGPSPPTNGVWVRNPTPSCVFFFLLVPLLAPRVFLLWFPGFPHSKKTNASKFQCDQDQWTKSYSVEMPVEFSYLLFFYFYNFTCGTHEIRLWWDMSTDRYQKYWSLVAIFFAAHTVTEVDFTSEDENVYLKLQLMVMLASSTSQFFFQDSKIFTSSEKSSSPVHWQQKWYHMISVIETMGWNQWCMKKAEF